MTQAPNRNQQFSRREFIGNARLSVGAALVGVVGGVNVSDAQSDKGLYLDEAELLERLDTYGPFPPRRRRIVLISTGNDFEDHGPAMAPSSDTHFAQAFSAGASLRTGVRYLGNSPYTTDLAWPSARLFCPIAVSAREYFERTTTYCSTLLNHLAPRPEGVVIHVPWHGQQIMGERLNEFARRLRVRKVHLVPDIVVDSIKRLKPDEYEQSAVRQLVREGIEGSHFQHCGLFDYCVAEALGHLDRAKLDQLRHEMETDLEGALRRHPSVHNLAGYVRFGGPEFDSLRKALGLKPGDPLPPVDPKWQNSCAVTGRAMVKHTTDILVERILAFDRELFGAGV